jgi:hypothetical protein
MQQLEANFQLADSTPAAAIAGDLLVGGHLDASNGRRKGKDCHSRYATCFAARFDLA